MEDWKKYQELGLDLYRKGKFEESIDAYKKSLELNEDLESYKFIGNSLMVLGRNEDAVVEYKKCIEISENWYFYKALGWALLGSNRLKEAENAYRKSLCLHQEHESYLGLGLTLNNLSRYEEAINAYRMSLGLQEGWRAYQELGLTLNSLSRYIEARDMFSKSLSIIESNKEKETVNTSFVKVGLSKSLEGMQLFEEALKVFFDASDPDEKEWDCIHSIGRKLVNNSNYDLAIRYFSLATKRYTNIYETEAALVWAIIKSGRSSEYQNYISNLVISEKWDLIDFYLNGINHDIDHIYDKESARYMMYKLNKVKCLNSRDAVRYAAINEISLKDGLIMEFGVHKGDSIRLIANSLTNQVIHGFDSFYGLPEDYVSFYRKGAFSTEGNLPLVPSNVQLHQGWFNKTLPLFLKNNKVKYSSLIHIDCDLYSSTKTVLSLLNNTIVPGSIIIFDEYFNGVGWKENEFKAFQEYVEEYGVTYEYIFYSRIRASNVVVRITDKK